MVAPRAADKRHDFRDLLIRQTLREARQSGLEVDEILKILDTELKSVSKEGA